MKCVFFPVLVGMYFSYYYFLVILQTRKLDDSEFRNAFSRAHIRVWAFFLSAVSLKGSI